MDEAGPVRKSACQILEAYGYRAITTADGTEALVVYLQQKESISVMIVDMTLPFLDGPATIQALRKVNPKVRVILTSDPLSDEQSRTMQQTGADALVAKHYTAETLLRTLNEVILGADEQGMSENPVRLPPTTAAMAATFRFVGEPLRFVFGYRV